MKKTSIKKEAKSPGGFLREYLGTPVFATVALLVLLAAGVYSFVSLPRTVNPEINLTLVNLSAVLPGASPEEVEKLLAVPLEKELSGLGGLKNITSLAGEGHLLATLEFEDEIDRQTAVAEARAAVSRVDLPSLARRVTVKAVNFEDEPILRAAVYDSAGPVALQKNVRAIKEEMEKSSLIDRVYADGVGKKKIYISAPAEEFFLRGVTPPLLRELIWQKMLSQPAGEVRQGESALPLTVSGSVSTLDDLRALPLKTAQGSYRLGDFARVIEMEDPSTLGAFITDRDGHIRPAAVLTVYRSLNAPIAAATAEAEKILRTAEEKSPTLQTVKIWSVNDDMNEQFADLGRNLVLTVILVFALLWFFVGFAQAAAAALSIPMVYLGAFAVMYFFDLSINFITLFSLLLGLGLLVDVTIVIISALAVRLRRAEEALSAAMAVWREFAGALAITTLTTVWAFLPLFLSSGVIGEYIKPIPIVVTAILTFSFLVGFGIILPLSVAWARRLTAGGKVAGKFSLGGRPSGFAASVGFLEKTYRKVLRKIIFRPRFRRSVWAVLTVFFLVSFALPVLGLVRNEFFPSTDFSYLYVSAELPAAASAEKSRQVGLRLLPEMAALPGVKNVAMQIGVSLDERNLPVPAAKNFVLLTLLLEGKGKPSSRELAARLRKSPLVANFSAARLRVAEVTDGPPLGSDLTLKLYGPDLVDLSALAEEVMAELRSEAVAVNLRKSVDDRQIKLVFEPDERKMAENGFSTATISAFLRAFTDGLTLVENVYLDDLPDRRDIVLAYTADKFDPSAPRAEDLAGITLFNKRGERVPFSSLGEFRPKSKYSKITRSNGRRMIVVTADAAGGLTSTELGNLAAKMMKEKIDLPPGYDWEIGGVNEENQKSVTSILKAMLLALALLTATLVAYFRSWRRALAVLAAVPPSVAGVFLVFAVVGVPLSFPSLIGILALMGIVVNNSIIIVSRVMANLKEGKEGREAILEGAVGRLEPITLSSLTTIIGLLPITLSDPIWAGLGGAIIAGLVFSGTVMLLLVPLVYLLLLPEEFRR